MLYLFKKLNFSFSKTNFTAQSNNGGANVSGHEVESLKPKRIRFESRATFLKLGFVSAANYFIDFLPCGNVAESKKSYIIVEELIKLEYNK